MINLNKIFSCFLKVFALLLAVSAECSPFAERKDKYEKLFSIPLRRFLVELNEIGFLFIKIYQVRKQFV